MELVLCMAVLLLSPAWGCYGAQGDIDSEEFQSNDFAVVLPVIATKFYDGKLHETKTCDSGLHDVR